MSYLYRGLAPSSGCGFQCNGLYKRHGGFSNLRRYRANVGDAPHTASSLVCRRVDDSFLIRQSRVVNSGRSLGGHLYGDASA